MRWQRENGGLVIRDWTPDKIMERNERLAWAVANRRPWRLMNGALVEGSRDTIAEDLRQAYQKGRREWRGRLHDLAMAGELVGAEGTYMALGAYPLAGELSGLTLSTTESLALTGTGAQQILAPIPGNGVLSPQAYRMVFCSRYTVTTTPGSLVTTLRIGNANTSPSLGASAAVALTASLTAATIILKGDITIQQAINVPGTNSKAIGHFDIKINTAVGGAYNAAAWQTGATAASFDVTLTTLGANGGGLWIGMNDSGATNHATVTPQQVHFMDAN